MALSHSFCRSLHAASLPLFLQEPAAKQNTHAEHMDIKGVVSLATEITWQEHMETRKLSLSNNNQIKDLWTSLLTCLCFHPCFLKTLFNRKSFLLFTLQSRGVSLIILWSNIFPGEPKQDRKSKVLQKNQESLALCTTRTAMHPLLWLLELSCSSYSSMLIVWLIYFLAGLIFTAHLCFAEHPLQNAW